MEIVQNEGGREIIFYNLDGIISLGYRINSQKAINEYKGFNKQQKVTSDFDNDVKKLQESQGEQHEYIERIGSN